MLKRYFCSNCGGEFDEEDFKTKASKTRDTSGFIDYWCKWECLAKNIIRNRG